MAKMSAVFVPASSLRILAELDRGAVRHRIGEGHAQLDHIRAARDEGVEDGSGGAVAAGHEGDEGRVAFGEGGGEAGHDKALSPSGERVGRGEVSTPTNSSHDTIHILHHI